MRKVWKVVPAALLATGFLVPAVAADARPANKDAPQNQRKSVPGKQATSAANHCEGPWLDRGTKPCPAPAASEASPANKVNTVEDIYAPPREHS